jgi:hypothetical protein
MYDRIERKYRKRVTDKKIKKVGAITIALIFITAFSKNIGIQLVFLLLLLIVSIIYFYNYTLNNIKYKSKLHIYKNYLMFKNKKHNNRVKIMKEILREEGLHDKEKLIEIKNHYQKNIPIKIKENNVKVFWEISISIVAIIIPIIKIDNTGVDFTQTGILMGLSVSIIVYIFTIFLFSTTLKDIYSFIFNKYEINREFENILSEIILKYKF